MLRLFDSLTPRFDGGIYKICMVTARLGLAYLFFTQLFWKLPPGFGCGADFAFPKPTQDNFYDSNKSSGLCFWMGLESIYASQPRQVLVADLRPAGLPTISLNITPLAELNGFLLDSLLIPRIQLFGWLIWLAEFWIFLSMLLGLFTRLGGLVSILVSLQLYIGLANIPRPFEWEWSYGTIVLLSVAMLGSAAGRFLGVDGWFRQKLATPAGNGNRLAKIGLILT
ncbi:MAG: hypothetical protein A2Z16_10550 [Chloroflexi bacterium RBG_16_54_18]|nr:MAG: hypothetical protein A2Z16_10550 [Chloroflexi bacterium RBG_16_54_18]